MSCLMGCSDVCNTCTYIYNNYYNSATLKLYMLLVKQKIKLVLPKGGDIPHKTPYAPAPAHTTTTLQRQDGHQLPET